MTAYTLIPSGAVVSVSNYAYGGDSTLLIFRDSAEPVESDLSGRAVWLSAAGNKVAALLSSSVVSTDLTTGGRKPPAMCRPIQKASPWRTKAPCICSACARFGKKILR